MATGSRMWRGWCRLAAQPLAANHLELAALAEPCNERHGLRNRCLDGGQLQRGLVKARIVPDLRDPYRVLIVGIFSHHVAPATRHRSAAFQQDGNELGPLAGCSLEAADQTVHE